MKLDLHYYEGRSYRPCGAFFSIHSTNLRDTVVAVWVCDTPERNPSLGSGYRTLSEPAQPERQIWPSTVHSSEFCKPRLDIVPVREWLSPSNRNSCRRASPQSQCTCWSSVGCRVAGQELRFRL